MNQYDSNNQDSELQEKSTEPISLKKLALICSATAIVGFSSAFFLCGGKLPARTNDKPAVQEQVNDIPTTDSSLERRLTKISQSGSYIPQNKDKNGVCGIAINEDGKRVAVTSDGSCPNNDTLFDNYGYAYESLTDDFRPRGSGDFCGYAHFVKGANRIGTKDMAKLNAMMDGDLDNILVKPNGMLCPTQAELSGNITNSIGVPVHFEYNDFDANPNRYPALMVGANDIMQDIVVENPADRSITKELSGLKIMDARGKYIPKILLTPDAKKNCDGNFGACLFDERDMSLTSVNTGETYQLTTHDGYVLPTFMMTKGAWDACGGIFTQCDYTPDDEFPRQRGTVTNRITHKSYTSKPVSVIEEDIG